MNQVEILLRMSENAVEQGDVIAARHHEERAAHARELASLHQMIEVARQNVEAEMQRWGYRGPKTPDVGQGQIPANVAKDNPAPQTPGFLLKGGANAAGTRVESRDDKPQHPRAIPSRV